MTSPNLKGPRPDADIVNQIADAIVAKRKKEILSHGTEHKPKLVTYVGSEQMLALKSIERKDANSPKNDIFLGTQVVLVAQSSYLHVVTK